RRCSRTTARARGRCRPRTSTAPAAGPEPGRRRTGRRPPSPPPESGRRRGSSGCASLSASSFGGVRDGRRGGRRRGQAVLKLLGQGVEGSHLGPPPRLAGQLVVALHLVRAAHPGAQRLHTERRLDAPWVVGQRLQKRLLRDLPAPARQGAFAPDFHVIGAV